MPEPQLDETELKRRGDPNRYMQDFDLLQAIREPAYVEQYNAAAGAQGGEITRPFSAELNRRLERPIDIDAGESIFDAAVVSRYFDDPTVSERDKETILYTLKPSLAVQAFNEKTRLSVGEPVRSKGILGRAMSVVTDIAGKPIDRVFDALEYPSDRAEQIFGTVLSYGYDSDLSLSERWQMGRLTYEAYGQKRWWFLYGDEQLNEWSQQVASGEKTIDEVIEENEHGVPDLVGKMILDPLWLLGGFPAVPGKFYKGKELLETGAVAYKSGLAAGFFKGMAEGIRLEEFGTTGTKATSLLQKIPYAGDAIVNTGRLLFGQFVPSDEKIMANALSEWRGRIATDEVDDVITSWRDAKGLFNLTPQAKADHIYTHLASTIALGDDVTQADIVQLARAIETGNIDAVPEVFGAAFRTESGQILFRAMGESTVDMRRFPSMMKSIAPNEAVWDAAEPAVQATMHRNKRMFHVALQADIHNKAYPALQRWHGVRGNVRTATLKNGEIVEKFYPENGLMQKFANGSKFWLSTVTLNRPGFVALNYLNNGMTLAFDYGLSRGIKYWLDPQGKRGFYERELHELMVENGLDPEIIKRIVGDRSVAREMLLGGADDKTLGIANKWWAPAVAVTAHLDMGARMHAFYEMYGRAANATWKFEGKHRGVIPNLPPALEAALGPELSKRLRGAIIAAGPNPEKLRKIVDDLRQHGRPPLTAEQFIDEMAEQMGLGADETQALFDSFHPSFRERITAILADAGNDGSRLNRRLDVLEGALRQQEHQAREMDRLTPRSRDYRNLPTAAADHEALMAEHDKTYVMMLQRYLNAIQDPNVHKIVQRFAEWQSLSRERRYTLHYLAQVLELPPNKLESDVLFELIPEHLRGKVAGMHREIWADGKMMADAFEDTPQLYDFTAELAERWNKHFNDETEQFLAFLQDAGMDEARLSLDMVLRSFFDSVGVANRDVKKRTDSMFARLVETLGDAITGQGPLPTSSADFQDEVFSIWTEHYRQVDNLYNHNLEQDASLFGFEHRFEPHARAGDNPINAEQIGIRNGIYSQLIDFVRKGFPHLATDQPFMGAADDLASYIDEIVAMAPDARRVQTMIARRAADFTMLNYDNRYGLDQWMQMVYPYAFWPTRSMWHWAQRGLSRPGAVAATAKLYELIEEINTDADVPERFRHSIRMGIPFLDESLQGGPLFFDPIKVLFPTADWSNEDRFGNADGHDGTYLGVPRTMYSTLNQAAKSVGPGVHPFLDTFLQHAGGDERALYIKYRMSSLPFMIPGRRVQQAAWSFVHTGEDPDNALTEEDKEALSMGLHLPEDRLKQILGMNDDDLDLYRTQRVLGNLVGLYYLEGHSLEERKEFTREALDAMFTREGKLWKKARAIGRKESGLAILTGWMFGVPVRQYPNGEDTMRGLQGMYREVQAESRAEGGGDRTADFLEMVPEVQVRDASTTILEEGSDKQDQEIAQSLFAIDADKVHKKYDGRIEELNGTLESLARMGVLKSEEGRRQFDILEQQRNALAQQRSLELDDLDKRYDIRNQEPSLARTPRTRALQELEAEYYKIELPESATSLDFEKQKAAQQAFLESRPRTRDYNAFVEAINHYEMTRKYDREITAAYDAGDREKAEKLITERQDKVREKTAQVKAMISQRDLRGYLDRNKRTPTSQEMERDMASEQISEYFAIRDRATSLGYSSREASELARSFWEAHPLLSQYYGDSNISVDSYEDIAAFDRMETIWDQFYALEGGAQSRIDYLAMVLDELNRLRRRFGLPPIKIQDPYWNESAPPPRYEGSPPQGY